jgi:hypothetical protein
MSNDMAELEQELSFIFMELETGCTLDADQIATLKYACGFKDPKPASVKHLENLFYDFSNIFRNAK